MGLKIPAVFIDTHDSWNLWYGHKLIIIYVLLLSFGPSKKRKYQTSDTWRTKCTEGSQDFQMAIFF